MFFNKALFKDARSCFWMLEVYVEKFEFPTRFVGFLVGCSPFPYAWWLEHYHVFAVSLSTCSLSQNFFCSLLSDWRCAERVRKARSSFWTSMSPMLFSVDYHLLAGRYATKISFWGISASSATFTTAPSHFDSIFNHCKVTFLAHIKTNQPVLRCELNVSIIPLLDNVIQD